MLLWVSKSALALLRVREPHLIEMGGVRLAEIELLLLSEPAKLRFDHLLLSAERGQVEEVESLAGVT